MNTIRYKIALILAASAVGTVVQASEPSQPYPSQPESGYQQKKSPSLAVYDSFNRWNTVNATATKTTTTTTDNSRKVDVRDSFNRSTTTTIDASRKAVDSYNTDKSRHAVDSYNTDNSRRYDTRIDTQTVAPTVYASQHSAALDTQTASNSGYQSGHEQKAAQGGFSLNMGMSSAGDSNRSGGYKSPLSVNENRTLTASNTASIGGDNSGTVANTIVAGQGSGHVAGGHLGSIVGSDLGNKQVITAGDQTQLQANSQDKKSATSSGVSNQVNTSASK